jgi:hypothetical protein
MSAPGFRDTDEILAAIRGLIADLGRTGHPEAATGLVDGLACLNGLTDGWALLLEAIGRVRAADSGRFSPDQRRALDSIRAAVHGVVHRR